MNHRKLSRALVSLLICFVVFTSTVTFAQTRTTSSEPGQRGKRPRLVLLIVIDQFRYDYLERFNDLFVSNGLKRLMRDGASWTQSNYDHFPTSTAPGHATMMTGAYPAETGIVGNEWPDRTTGKNVSSVSDTTVKQLGGIETEPTASPRKLISSTVGDELRLATNDRSKVIGISSKDRSAILPSGRHANGAYWFSGNSGTMVSSTYYFSELPGWVTAYNRTKPADKFFRKQWDRLLPESEYLKRAGADSPSWENIGTAAGDTNAFPHIVTGGAQSPTEAFYNALEYTPFANDVLLEFAQVAITSEGLGQDEDTDVLTLSFSANDYVGHRYGPYSQEVMDITLRVDRQIETLLNFVNSRVGLANTVVALTADHGVAPIPEHASVLGLSGGRLRSTDFMTAIRSAITTKYNAQNKTPDPTADYIYKYEYYGAQRDAFTNGNLYFNYTALKRDGVTLDEISQLAGETALTIPGVARFFTRSQLLRGATSITDPIERRVLHGFYPTRSGDLVLIAEPYKYLTETVTATHGSPYTYDTNVPTIIMGAGITPGRYYEAATPADIAPTLSALLGITKPSAATGRVLVEALKK